MSKLKSAATSTLSVDGTDYTVYDITKAGLGDLSRLPYSIRVFLEAAIRKEDGFNVTDSDIRSIAGWESRPSKTRPEIPFFPARVVWQDLTGGAAIADFAAMRDVFQSWKLDPQQINPLVQTDLVVDHSVQVERFASRFALTFNQDDELKKNENRFRLIRWAQDNLRAFRAIAPGYAIVHQANLEYLSPVVQCSDSNVLYPDSLVGGDSHTPMINGIGVVGWGVGGIEAESVMLGESVSMLLPDVIGIKLTGKLPEGATATDLILLITAILRKKGVVDKIVEFCGPGLESLRLEERATVANMAADFGATMSFFPVDRETINYMVRTGRTKKQATLTEKYCQALGLFRDASSAIPDYTEIIDLDLGTIVPCIAGPTQPYQRVPVSAQKAQWPADLKQHFKASADDAPVEFPLPPLVSWYETQTPDKKAPEHLGLGESVAAGNPLLGHGMLAIAAITSCTNTSNPRVLVGAGLLAKAARANGLRVKPWVKTSLAPGSQVATAYLEKAGLQSELDGLGFFTVGYGCTTCIGNSGPLPAPVSQFIKDNKIFAAAALSGNRNFTGRVHPDVQAGYLMSPMLVVAYALAGRIDVDFESEPLGTDATGKAVFLRDIWPKDDDIQAVMDATITAEMFRERYKEAFSGSAAWQAIEVPKTAGGLYAWKDERGDSFVQQPPFFDGMKRELSPISSISGARCLAAFGDDVTTDHISPAANIPKESDAGQYLIGVGETPANFVGYGARRANHNVMMRGTFANIRLRNELVTPTEGSATKYFPTGEQLSIFQAAMRYKAAGSDQEGTPLVILAGNNYGTGSSRDWAAKGPKLLGVRVVIAKSFERIHRSNLVGMGLLPLEFMSGEGYKELGLDGSEEFSFAIDDSLQPRQEVTVTAKKTDGSGAEVSFKTRSRIDTNPELESFQHGGILPKVLRKKAVMPKAMP